MPRLRLIRWFAAVVLALASVYAILGIVQALSLFRGERALWNVNLWSSLALIAGTVAWLSLPKKSQSSPPSVVQRGAPWIHTALALFFAWQVISHLASVDRCLDRGGSFDYVGSVCNFEQSFPFVPLHRTHGFPLTAVVVFGLLAIRGRMHLYTARRSSTSAA